MCIYNQCTLEVIRKKFKIRDVFKAPNTTCSIQNTLKGHERQDQACLFKNQVHLKSMDVVGNKKEILVFWCV